MDIRFAGNKLRKVCNDSKSAQRQYGRERAEVLRQRLDEIRASENLSVLGRLPQARCHELKGDRKGQLAVKLDRQYRLIFKVGQDPVPRKADGGLDWIRVTAVVILEMEDYHG